MALEKMSGAKYSVVLYHRRLGFRLIQFKFLDAANKSRRRVMFRCIMYDMRRGVAMHCQQVHNQDIRTPGMPISPELGRCCVDQAL